MKVSNKLRIFILLSILYSVLAVPLLKSGWNHQGAGPGIHEQLGPNGGDILIGVSYTFLLTFSGFMLAKLDKRREYRGNIALHYHLVAVIVASIAALLDWLFLTYFGWRYVAWVAIVGGGSYGLHWLKAHNNLKGINKEEAFK